MHLGCGLIYDLTKCLKYIVISSDLSIRNSDAGPSTTASTAATETEATKLPSLLSVLFKSPFKLQNWLYRKREIVSNPPPGR